MSTVRWVLGLLLTGLAMSGSLAAPVHAAPFAYIANSADDTVSVLDTATNTVTATVPVGTNPCAVAVSPDGTRVYVANGAVGSVSVIDTATNTVTATVPVGSGPFALAVMPDGARVYVSNYNDYTVSVVDTATNTVATTIPIGQWPYGVTVAPDGSRVYVAVYGRDMLAAIDTATNTVTATVAVGTAPLGIAVTPEGSHVYVANYLSNDVSVVSTSTNTVVATVPAGPNPEGIAVTPDGSRVYVANFGGYGSVWVIATSSNTAMTSIKVGGGPRGIATTPDGERVYVANYWDNSVSVIATATNTVLATVPVGTQPDAFGQFIGPDVRDRVGTFRPSDGAFYLDHNGNGTWDGCGTDRCLSVGMNGDIPLVGDWNGSGSTKVGTFRPTDGAFYLDYNGNGQWDGCGTDRCLSIGLNGDIPLVGDWSGSGTAKVGTFRPTDGAFYLDYNGNGAWDGCGTDRCLSIGLNGDIPLVGDWNGSGTAKVGTFRPSDGAFYLDYNGSGTWEGCGTDRCLSIGLTGDIPLVGDWNGSGTTKVGTFRASDAAFYLDSNGNGQWDGCDVDRCLQIGLSGDVPLVGDWDATATTKVGTFRPSDGTYYLDFNGNGVWDGCGVDRCISMGLNGDTPLVGRW